jgi:hypothetical protein
MAQPLDPGSVSGAPPVGEPAAADPVVIDLAAADPVVIDLAAAEPDPVLVLVEPGLLASAVAVVLEHAGWPVVQQESTGPPEQPLRAAVVTDEHLSRVIRLPTEVVLLLADPARPAATGDPQPVVGDARVQQVASTEELLDALKAVRPPAPRQPPDDTLDSSLAAGAAALHAAPDG